MDREFYITRVRWISRKVQGIVLSLSAVFGNYAGVLYERDFQVLLLANIMGPLGTSMISPVLDSLIDPMGASPADIGLVMSLFTAPGIVMYLIVGLLADRYGRKPVLVIALLVFGTAGTLIAFTTTYEIVLGLRFLQGIAFGGITPIIITSLGDMYSGDREATAQGIRFTGSGITSTVFPLLAGGLVIIAWQFPFLLYAISIPIAGLVFTVFTEPTDIASGESADKRDTHAQLVALGQLVRQTRVLAMVIARGLPMIIWIGFITYNSIVVVQILGSTPAYAGGLVAVASVTYAGAASQAGRITTIFSSRLYPLIGANLCLGVGFGVFLFAPVLVMAGVGIAIVGVGFGLTLSLYRSVITGLADEARRAGLVTVAEAFGRVTTTLTPIIMGGVIAVLSPQIGLAASIQFVGLGCAVVGGLGGVGCLLVMRASPSVEYAIT